MEQLLEERNELGVKYKAFNDMDTAAEEQRENDEGLGIEEEDHEEAIEKTKAVLKEAMRELKSKDYELQEAVANYERVTGRPAPYDATDEFYDKVNWTAYRGTREDYDDYNEDNFDPNYNPHSNVDPDNSSSNNHDNNSDNNDGGNDQNDGNNGGNNGDGGNDGGNNGDGGSDSGDDGYGSSGDSKVISEHPDVVIETEVSELEDEEEYEEIQNLDLDWFKDIPNPLNNTENPSASTLIDLILDILKQLLDSF